MSFLKKLLYIPEKGKRSTTPSTERSAPVQNNDSHAELFQKECQFSMDAIGTSFELQWKSFNSNFKSQSQSIEHDGSSIDADNKHQRNKIFRGLMCSFVVGHSTTRTCTVSKYYAPGRPTLYSETSGHPTLFVLQIAIHLLDILGNEDSSSNKVADINLETFYPNELWDSKGYISQPMTDLYQLCYSHRSDLLNTLKCLSVVSIWSHNCVILKNNLGKEFVKFFLRLLQQLLCVLERVQCAWVGLNGLQTEFENGSSQWHGYLERSLQYSIECILLAVQFIARCNSNSDEREIGDLLPNQPWSIDELTMITGCNFSESLSFMDNCVELTQASNGISNDAQNVELPTTPADGVASTALLYAKKAFVADFIDAGAVENLTAILRHVHTLIVSTSVSGVNNESRKQFSYRIMRHTLTLQAECLFALSGLLSEHPSAAESFCNLNQVLILNNIIVCHPSSDLLISSSFVERLVVRRSILCLRVNNSLSDNSAIHASTDCSISNYSSMLELPAICEFLFWVSSQFDDLDRYASSILSGTDGASLQNLTLSVDFQDKFRTQNALVFDLWPWQVSKEADLEHTVKLSEECSYYHLMPPTAAEHLKRRVLRILPGYVVWDSILAELVGSRLFSYLSTTTNRSAPPSNSSNNKKTPSSSSKKLSTKRNIYFVFVLFHQLFHEKLSTYGKKSSRIKNSIPLCQIKFSEYICQLFKAAEPEDIFAIINDFELFEILFGEMFLLGDAALSKDLFSEDVMASRSQFKSVGSRTPVNGSTNMFWSNPTDILGLTHCFWALLHDNVFDFFNGLVVYSLYFQASTSTVKSYVSYEDVIVLLVNFVIPTLRLGIGESSLADSFLTTTVPSSIGYRVMLLLHNLSETISSLGDHEKNIVRRKTVNKLLEFVDCKLKVLNPGIGKVLSDKMAQTKNETTRITFEWLECYAAVSLLLRLTSMSTLGNTRWSEILTSTETNNDYLAKDQDGSSNFAFASDIPVTPPPKLLTISPPKYLIRKTTSLVDGTVTTSDSTSSADGLSLFAKNRIKSLVTLLLEPRTRAAGIHLMNDILSLCISASTNLTNYEAIVSSGSDSHVNINMLVVAEVLRIVIVTIGQAAQLPVQSDGFNMTLDVLNSLTWLLRSSRFVIIRRVLQETFKPFMYDFLSSLTSTMFEFREQKARDQTTKNLHLHESRNDEGQNSPSLLLRQGLALLTGILSANDATKTEFAVICQHSKESNREFTSHLFGNFRNIDKVKRLSAAANVTTPSSKESNSRSFITAGFQNIKEMILAAEYKPTMETLVVVFELVLDGHSQLFDSSLLNGDTSRNALFMNDEDRPKIKNVSLIPDIFSLVPHCDPSIQQFILVSFHNLITGRASLVNLNACSLSKPRVIDLALDLFPMLQDEVQVYNVLLLQSLGKHGISVAMLKHLFRILQSKGEARPSYSWRVIQALQGMISEEDGPRQTFVFEGTNSGLKLPSIYKWPATRGYSFCSWLKIEAPKKATFKRLSANRCAGVDDSCAIDSIYSPYIVCLRSNSGAGLELYLQPSKMTGMFRVVLKIYSDAGETSTLSPELKGMKIAEGRWHFLGFSVSAATFYSKSEACIQLDDQYVRHTFNSVKLPDSIVDPLIGDCIMPLRREGHNNTLRGQMGAFYFFAECLSEGQFRSIHALGPDYIYNFEPFSASYQNVTGLRRQHQRVDPVLSILDGSLTPHIILAYNPVVWKGEYFLDNTPLKNDIRWKSLPHAPLMNIDDILYDGAGYCRMHARRLKGTYRSITQDVRMALNSLGGVKTVFPLFAQLHQPRIITTRNYSSEQGSSSEDNIHMDTSFDPNFLPSILGLLINLLENNIENQTIFLRISGFAIISHLLEKVSPEHFSSLTLDRLIELFNKLESNFALQENYLDYVLCNFKFWVFTPLATQLRLFSLLGELISLNTYHCESLSFQRLIDLLYLLYDYDTPQIDRMDPPTHPQVQMSDPSWLRRSISSATTTSSQSSGQLSRSQSNNNLAGGINTRNFLKSTIYSSDVWVRVDTGEAVATKLKGGELHQVRSRIFSLLNGILQTNKAFLPEDVQSLVFYLVQSTSTLSKVEILIFILNLLNNETSNFLVPHMLLGFAMGKSVKLFNSLYSHDDVQIRLLTLVLFCKVVNLALDYKLLPDIPRNSRYFKSGASRGMGVGGSDDLNAIDSDNCSVKTRTGVSKDSMREIPMFSDTFEALDISPSNLLNIFLFIQDQLLSKQNKCVRSTAGSALQNKIIACILQLTMVGESCSFLLSTIMEAFGDGELKDERIGQLDKALDVQFGDFQIQKLASASLCVPMIFLSLLSFVQSELISVELRLSVVLNLKTCVSRSAKNCDRVLSIDRWHDSLLLLMMDENRRHQVLVSHGEGRCESNVMSKSIAVREVCLRILCDVQSMAVRIGRPLVETVTICRNNSSSRELTPIEVVKCITRGDRLLGSTVLVEIMMSLKSSLDVGADEHVKSPNDKENSVKFVTTTCFALLEKSIGTLQQECEALCDRSDKNSSQSHTDLIQDHAEKILHLNTWLIASVLMNLMMSLPCGNNIDEDLRTSTLQFVVQTLLGVLEPLFVKVPLWMFEEKSFRVHAGSASSPDMTSEKMNKLLLLPSAQLRSGGTYVAAPGATGSPSLKGSPRGYRLPLSHAPGGMFWIIVRILCRIHLMGSADGEDNECSFCACVRLKETFRSSDNYPDFYEREAFYVISLFSEALRNSRISRSQQWIINTVEVVIELSTSVKGILQGMIDDNSYAQSFAALSESADNSRLKDSSSSMESDRTSGLSVLLNCVDTNDCDAITPGYEILLTSVSQLLTTEDEQPIELIWTRLMEQQVQIGLLADEALLRFRQKEIGVFIPDSEQAAVSLCSPANMQQRSSDGKCSFSNDWLLSSLVFKNACIETQSSRLRDWIKQVDSQNRRHDSKWMAIFTELANERGPWGYCADDQREVYWMLDDCETNMHVKMRMRRNDAGTRHLMATQKSFGRHTTYNADNHPDSLLSTSVKLLGEQQDPGHGIQGIYKDLKKYKKHLQYAKKPFIQQATATEGEASEKGNNHTEEEDGYSDLDDDSVDVLESTVASEQISVDVDLLLFTCAAEVITAATNSSGGHTVGKIEITKSRISFSRTNENDTFDFVNKTGNSEFMWACQSYPSRTWSGDDICAVCERQYQMRHVAVELFFTSRTSVLLNLFEVKNARKMCRLIRTRVKTANLNMSLGGQPKEAIAKGFLSSGMSATQAWVQHKITNFEYLMHLNVTAGRTFNDLAQYPIFPWVLSDYTSTRIDLRDPKFFRDFRWPMGAQVDSQRQLLIEKYEASASLQDDEVLPYHTGSHYSTAAMVIWYLIRMEPFTSFHVWLQDGKFDRPDRLFHSIDSTWKGCTSNPQDVKELIPEFFFNPEFLENVNDISFGVRQNGKSIDNVDMPAWCKDASDFVRINREALESDFVSKNLHHWIDLVFGQKQRPPHLIGGSELAVDACNVFVHLTYPDAVNLEEIKNTDSVLYDRTIRQIDNYGQTPVQLFDKPHPERLPFDRVDVIWPIGSVVTGVDTIPRAATPALQQLQQLDKPSKVLCYGDYKVSASPILLIMVCGGALEKLVVVDSTRVIGYHGFQVRQPDIVPPFSIKIDKSSLLVSASAGRGRKMSSYLTISSSMHTKEKLAGVPFASQGVLLHSQQGGKHSACVSDFDYARIGTPGNKIAFLDEELQSRIKSVENDRRFQQQSKSSTRDLSPRIKKSSSSTNLPGAVNDISGSPVSLSKDTVVATGRQINRRERVDEHLSCNLFAMLPDSKLLFSCAHWDNSFKVTAADTGRLIQSVSHHREVVTCLTVASDFGKHWLVTGSKDCIVIAWELCPEKESDPITTVPLHILYGHDDSVNCVAVNPELDIIVSGSDDGTVIIHTLRDGSYLRSILIGISQSMYAKAVSSLLNTYGGKSNMPQEVTSPVPSSQPRQHISVHSSSNSKRNTTPKSPRTENSQIYKRRVHLIVITRDGYIVTYSTDGNLLSTHTMNGRYVKMVDVKERLYAMCVSEDGKVIITGGERCLVVIRWVNNLTLANNGPRKDLDSVIDGSHDQEHAPFQSPIRSLCLTSQERHLIVGLESGHIRVLAQDSEYLRRKLHRKLMEIGILTF